MLDTQRQTILVFGSAGFIGNNLVTKLKNYGYTVFGVSRREHNPNGWQSNITSDFSLYDINRVIKQTTPCMVFLAYGSSSVSPELSRPSEPDDVLISMRIICESLLSFGRPIRLFLISSAAIYGNQVANQIAEISIPKPISIYGRKKLEIEKIVKEISLDSSLTLTILRVFSTFGTQQKKNVIWDMYTQFKIDSEERISFMGKGTELRDFIHIDNLVEQIIQLLNLTNSTPEPINLGSGVSRSIFELASSIKEITGSEREFEFSGISDPRHPTNLIPDLSSISELGIPLVEESIFETKLRATIAEWNSM